jgi:hypothetical protein
MFAGSGTPVPTHAWIFPARMRAIVWCFESLSLFLSGCMSLGIAPAPQQSIALAVSQMKQPHTRTHVHTSPSSSSITFSCSEQGDQGSVIFVQSSPRCPPRLQCSWSSWSFTVVYPVIITINAIKAALIFCISHSLSLSCTSVHPPPPLRQPIIQVDRRDEAATFPSSNPFSSSIITFA